MEQIYADLLDHLLPARSGHRTQWRRLPEHTCYWRHLHLQDERRSKRESESESERERETFDTRSEEDRQGTARTLVVFLILCLDEVWLGIDREYIRAYSSTKYMQITAARDFFAQVSIIFVGLVVVRVWIAKQFKRMDGDNVPILKCGAIEYNK